MQAQSKPTIEDARMYFDWLDAMEGQPALNYVNELEIKETAKAVIAQMEEAGRETMPPALLRMLDEESDACPFWHREESVLDRAPAELPVTVALRNAVKCILWYAWPYLAAALIFAVGAWAWIEAHK